MASRRPEDPAFRPEGAFEALARHGVRFVLVGAYAAQIRGIAGFVTADIDVTPALDAGNLQSLSEALHELGATVRIESHRLGPVRTLSNRHREGLGGIGRADSRDVRVRLGRLEDHAARARARPCASGGL